MPQPSSPFDPCQLHPSLWRAGQLARAVGRVLPAGYAALAAELPGGGWPAGGVTELLCTRPGVQEIRLLQPALAEVIRQKRRLCLLGPPHVPNLVWMLRQGWSSAQVVWVRPQQQRDLLWAGEQVLRSQAFGAVLMWLPQARPEIVRRLQILAQADDSAVWLFRPPVAAHESSAAPLRLSLAPVPGVRDAISVSLLKRRGPAQAAPLLLSLADGLPLAQPAASPDEILHETPDHAFLDRDLSARSGARRVAAPLV